ncbi:MAG: hypothetical protein R3B70_45195 [Polyangiaceae bacterium]
MLDDLLSNPWAYLPPRSSLWLWVGGPLLVALIYFLTRGNSAARKRRLREADIWRRSIADAIPRAAEDNKEGAPFRPDKSKKKPAQKATEAGPSRVAELPPSLRGALAAATSGEQIAHFELVRDLAYLSIVESNLVEGSDSQVVTARLEERAPQMVVRPLPIVDGVPVANSGVLFKKDPELMKAFLIEGPDAKAIGKWMSAPIRRALCKVPGAWLRVQGNTMTVSAFGSLEADELDGLVELADEIFAEHGAEGGPSLFGDGDDRAPEPVVAPAKKKAKKSAPPATATTLAETPSSKKR